MIRSITRLKSDTEIDKMVTDLTRVFIAGCGTCATMTGTGGLTQVETMQNRLRSSGKVVTGSMVIPVACDELTWELLEDHREALDAAEAVVMMSCAYGVQTICDQLEKPVLPALDTLFIGRETSAGIFQEVCRQCGDCLLDRTGGLCPVSSCHKGLVNGPCGGTRQGKCEVDPEKDCVWTLIYERLHDSGRLDMMRHYQPPRNHNTEIRPGKWSDRTREAVGRG